MSHSLSEEQVKELQEVFSLFDGGSGSISANDLGTVLSSLNQNCSEYELRDMRADAADGSGNVSFDSFCALIDKRLRDVTNHLDVREAFQTFDKDGSGSVSFDQLKTLLMTMGEKLSEEEAAELLQHLQPDGNGMVQYNEVIDKLSNIV